MDDLERSIKKLGGAPQKCVTKAAKAGASIPLKAAKKGGWVDQSGEMRKGIVMKGEKQHVQGKKVYAVLMDPAKNDIFVKMSKDGKKRYYYPASQEYGFRTRNGGYVPGFHFLKKAMEDNPKAIERKVVDVMSKEVDKALSGG
jgi:hypothetical protein